MPGAWWERNSHQAIVLLGASSINGKIQERFPESWFRNSYICTGGSAFYNLSTGNLVNLLWAAISSRVGLRSVSSSKTGFAPTRPGRWKRLRPRWRRWPLRPWVDRYPWSTSRVLLEYGAARALCLGSI